MRCSIKKTDLAIYALFLAVFKIYRIPVTIQQSMKIVLLVSAAFYLIRRCSAKQLLNKAIPLCVSIVISGILSCIAGIIPVKSVFDGILHAICLYLICLLMDFCQRNHYRERLLDCLFKITSIYCAISLVSIVLRVNSGNKSEIVYFFGYKFMTTYYYIFWLALYGMKYSNRIHKRIRSKYLYFLVSLIVLLICLWVDCATSVIAVGFVLIWQFIPWKLRRDFKRRTWIMAMVILAGLLPFFMSLILENSFVQNVVQNVLGRRLSLTGRMPIYMILQSYIEKRLWFGYGYGNTVIFQQLGYGNAQNGLLEHMLSYGLVGVMILFWTLWRCLKNRSCNEPRIEGWYTIFYALLIASVVEISFNYIFHMAVFALGSFRNERGELSHRVKELQEDGGRN